MHEGLPVKEGLPVEELPDEVLPVGESKELPVRGVEAMQVEGAEELPVEELLGEERPRRTPPTGAAAPL